MKPPGTNSETFAEAPPAKTDPGTDKVMGGPTNGAKPTDHGERRSIESVADLLHTCYVVSGRKPLTTPRGAVLDLMAKSGRIEGQEENLVRLALADRTLDRTSQLLLLALKIPRKTIAKRLGEFASLVLQRHPAFRMRSLAATLTGSGDVQDDKRTIDLLMAQDYSAFTWMAQSHRLKKSEQQRCRVNAVHCILMWFYLCRGLPVERAAHHLQHNVWKPATRQHRSEAAKLYAMISARGYGAAIAGTMLETQLRTSEEDAIAARAARDRADMRLGELKEKLETVRAAIAHAQAEKHRIQAELEQEQRLRADERAGLQDDYQRLRGSVLRRLRSDVSLLGDGLHALRRNPPKTQVMVDHAERVVGSLDEEIERLRRKGTT